MPGLFGYPQRLAVTRRCCFPDNLPCVKPFPVLSSHRSLVWLASRATRWRPWRGWNTRCPTCRVCTLHVCSSWNRAESRRKSRGKQNSLFLTVAISGRGENLNRKWSFLFAPETQDCCHNNPCHSGLNTKLPSILKIHNWQIAWRNLTPPRAMW